MSFSVGIRYITGYAVATDPGNRQRAEWPPHPARVFMAMAAACFETGEDAEEAEALRWLESLPNPVLRAADADERSVVTAYVPVNDKPIGAGILQSMAGLTRSRQPRTFPRVRPHNDCVYLVWPDAQLNSHREALDRLCGKVTRIGHSTSLVQMWIAESTAEEMPEAWEPEDLDADLRLRVIGPGSLEYLERQYGGRERREMDEQVAALNHQKTGQSNAMQKDLERQIKSLEEGRRDPMRPVMSLWQGYRRPRLVFDDQIPGTVWDPSLIIRRLKPDESSCHRRLDLASTVQVTAAFHKAVIEKATQPVAECICGHKPNGKPTNQPHLAFLPLAYVGAPHATGHLLGVGIAVPANLDRETRRQALAAVGQVSELTIVRLGRWNLDSDDEVKWNLRSETWTGGRSGSSQWATVTPIAFDTHPKAKDREHRERQLAEMIKTGCRRIGLPDPVHVVITPVSAHLGVPTSYEFPRFQRKDGSARRQAHAILIFEKAVRGPIAIGAGRYRGYGLCRPLPGGEVV